jgi:hypothetical protein
LHPGSLFVQLLQLDQNANETEHLSSNIGG